ncbi:MAG: helix-turn-helix transcriptional regulator [Candidatus Thiodiazotropha endolucinida]
MTNTILNANQAKNARSTLQLSQGKVAGDLNINRTYLSQFENGRYLFCNSKLKTIREYYESKGYNFPVESEIGQSDFSEVFPDVNTQTHGEYQPKVMDGFVIPDQIEDFNADAILSEYADNCRSIKVLCQQPIKKDWLFGIDEADCEQKAQDVLTLMARNFTLIERLHGHDTVMPSPIEKVDTIQDYITLRFTDQFSDFTDLQED